VVFSQSIFSAQASALCKNSVNYEHIKTIITGNGVKKHISTKFLILKHYTMYKRSDYLHNDFLPLFWKYIKISILSPI